MSKIAPLFTWRSAICSEAGPEHSTTRHVLLTISLYMSEKGEGAFPSMERLAKDTGLSLRSVKKHVPLAEELGWLSVVKKAGRGQGWKRNDYKANIPESYAQKMKEIEAKAVQEIHHEGGEGDSPPSKNVVHLVHEGGASKGKKVVQEVHLNTPKNTPSNSPEARARKTIKTSLTGIPIPDFAKSLFSVPDFKEAFLDYWIHRKENYNHWPKEINVVECYRELDRMKKEGHDVVKVIRQTIRDGNKSFYAIQDFKKAKHEVEETRYTPNYL